jgi:hypothetical protein
MKKYSLNLNCPYFLLKTVDIKTELNFPLKLLKHQTAAGIAQSLQRLGYKVGA